MDRDEMIKQLDRWAELVKQEAIILYDKGVIPARLMDTAIVVADGRLASEVAQRRTSVLHTPDFLQRTKAH